MLFISINTVFVALIDILFAEDGVRGEQQQNENVSHWLQIRGNK